MEELNCEACDAKQWQLRYLKSECPDVVKVKKADIVSMAAPCQFMRRATESVGDDSGEMD